MAISYIEIDTGQLNKDIGDLDNSIKKAETSLKELVQEMEELNSMWQETAVWTINIIVLLKHMIIGTFREYSLLALP